MPLIFSSLNRPKLPDYNPRLWLKNNVRRKETLSDYDPQTSQCNKSKHPLTLFNLK